MENKDSTRINSEALYGEEVDLQGTDHCHSSTCQSQNQDYSLESLRPNKGKDKVEELKLGMEFNSDESAYRAYVKFGGENGFNVRKHHRKKNKVGLITRVSYCCSKQGHCRNNNEIEDPSYSVPISRVGCDAHMTCLLQKNGNFKIVSFNASHNHDLVRTPMKHMLKINRWMSKAQKIHADDADKSGIPIKAIVELMGREVSGRENLGFLDKDYQNYIHKKRNLNMEKGDVGAILQYFQKMLVENSSSFYSMQLDEDDMITHIFLIQLQLCSTT
ncbi:hypothetical protein Ddye_007421 [Dipteronia dyeriana]|uniref:FAR1 domain-containing protein n=1 Tax=Dipteronia dyeriana TaxID=168575 RepID=A0AAD9XKD7_9ROSI|nr:hypothetical protein Ddye_007421 [Dipteronia dyeriana]